MALDAPVTRDRHDLRWCRELRGECSGRRVVVALRYREQQRSIRGNEEPGLGGRRYQVEIDADRTHEDGIVSASAGDIALPQPRPRAG